MKHFIRLIAIFLLLAFVLPAAAERLDDNLLLSYYDDGVFFGDSRMESFNRYVKGIQQTDETFLAKTKIVSAGSISLYAASRTYPSGDFLFYYHGRQLTMYGIAERVAPKKIFIMLGLNDPVGAKLDKALSWVEIIIQKMKEGVPDAVVYFLSETPVTEIFDEEKEREGYQDSLDIYNGMLKETCEANGARYIDIAHALKGEDNFLKLDYSNDRVCHLSDEGNAALIEALKDYAQEQYDLGLWAPGAEETTTEETDQKEEPEGVDDP